MNDTQEKRTPLILFPGMGADASSFLPQQIAMPHLFVPSWPIPKSNDDLASYCERLAADIDPGCPCYVGGASFGGIVALEIARHLDTRACFLIGSVRSPDELPRRIRAFGPFASLMTTLPMHLLQRGCSRFSGAIRRMTNEHVESVVGQFSRASADVLTWSMKQMLSWNGNYDEVPVFQIHGDQDHVIPIANTHPDEVVRGGGHVISLTHGDAVNEFLLGRMATTYDTKQLNSPASTM